MPNKGYRQPPSQRRAIAASNRAYRQRVADALKHYKPPKHVKMKGTKPLEKPDPTPTPVPPSASAITQPLLQRWALYSHHAEGKYYFKREHADTLEELHTIARKLELPNPLWTYVKSAHEPKDLFMPIRIPEEVIASLGHRWGRYHPSSKQFQKKKKENKT